MPENQLFWPPLKTATCKQISMSTPPVPQATNSQLAQNTIDTETMRHLSESREVLYGQNPVNFQSQIPNQNMYAPNMPNTNVNMIRPQVPPPSYLQSLPYTRMNEQSVQQQHQMYMNPESSSSQWIAQMLQTLNTRLESIEQELKTQNNKWQNVELTLNTQSSRMTSIEEQLQEMRGMQRNVNQMQISMSDMSRDINAVKGQMNEYDSSIQYYNEKYEDILKDQSEADKELEHLTSKVNQLQASYNSLQSQQINTESKVIDLQCRSMCENLIFSGINEHIIEAKNGKMYENSEQVLRNFLRDEMDIVQPIQFDRVHRLGAPRNSETEPRPIIAKFERYKDKEYVKMQAPNKLKGKRFGVNEQYPKEVEEVRKTLYGEMKRAKRNPQNRVKLIRDKLFVNNVQVNPRETSKYVNNSRPEYGPEQSYRKTRYSANTNDRTNKTRVFYPRTYESRQNPTTANRYEYLTHDDSEPRTPLLDTTNSRSGCGKKKAVSPLEEENLIKRQREQKESEHTDNNSVMSVQSDQSDDVLSSEIPNTQVTLSDHHTCTFPDGSLQQTGNQSGVNSNQESGNDE